MKKATIERFESGDQGTFGSITFGDHFLFTGEQPWRDNARNISCIPAGTYLCAFTWSPRFKRRLYLVNGTAPRTGIRIHPANLMGDRSKGFKSHLNGCIALGRRMGELAGQKAVLVSQPAVREFQEYMAGEVFELEIIDERTS